MTRMRPIRLVTFDALHTIITPRHPIYVQYSQVFVPYVGTLPPESIKQSFKAALKTVQKEHPFYNQGAEAWWRDVIRRTAIGAGANKEALDASLSEIVKSLLMRFSSKEGYAAFSDAIPTIRYVHDHLGIKTAVVSNGDSRIRAVLKDLDFPQTLAPVVLSEEEGIEKPSPDIFLKALEIVNQKMASGEGIISPEECLHIGDELMCDYKGAVDLGFKALLLRRLGPDGEQVHNDKDDDKVLNRVDVINDLAAVVPWLQGARR